MQRPPQHTVPIESSLELGTIRATSLIEATTWALFLMLKRVLLLQVGGRGRGGGGDASEDAPADRDDADAPPTRRLLPVAGRGGRGIGSNPCFCLFNMGWGKRLL